MPERPQGEICAIYINDNGSACICVDTITGNETHGALSQCAHFVAFPPDYYDNLQAWEQELINGYNH